MKKAFRFELALVSAFVVTILLAGFTDFAQECEEVRNSTVRLHILANSDSSEDQAIKLKVRDRVLEQISALFEESGSREQAERKIHENLIAIQTAAQHELTENGCYAPVRASLCRMYFPTRDYGRFTMPAGEYDALRIEIGQAEGKNWWCVAFPPLCIPAAEEDQALETFSDTGEEIITHASKYKVKFALVELYESIKDRVLSALDD